MVGILGQVITILFGIFIPRLILVNYGSEINGLLNSTTQFFAYFSLFEAGIGAVTLQALYKSIGNNNKDATNRVLSATHYYYKKVGLLYLAAVVLLALAYPCVVESTIPPFVIVLVIILNGVAPVSNFLYQRKYILLLQAEGKIYITNSLVSITNILTSIGKIVFLAMGFSIISVQLAAAIIASLQMFYIAWYVRKYYKWIDLSVKPNTDAISQSKNALTHQVAGLIFNNTDVVLLTFLTNLKVVSVYSMYKLLFGMVRTAIVNLNTSVTFVLGQSFHANRNKFNRIHKLYESCYQIIIFSLYLTAAIFIIPFLRLYTDSISDINYIIPNLALLFVITELLSFQRVPVTQIIEFAGHFKKTQWRAILESTIKLFTSIIGIYFIGIYGVLLGSIIALIYRSNDVILYTHKKLLKYSPLRTYKILGINWGLLFIIYYLIPQTSLEGLSYYSIFGLTIPYLLGIVILFTLTNILVDGIFRNECKIIIRKALRI